MTEELLTGHTVAAALVAAGEDAELLVLGAHGREGHPGTLATVPTQARCNRPGTGRAQVRLRAGLTMTNDRQDQSCRGPGMPGIRHPVHQVVALSVRASGLDR